MKIEQFANNNHIGIKVELVDENKNAPDWKDANHFKVVLRMGTRQLTTYFSQGYGITHEPTAAGVLECLASDSAVVDNARSFEDWAADLGYNPDSRKAEKIYNICEKQAIKLRNFLGDDLYEELLYHTEE